MVVVSQKGARTTLRSITCIIKVLKGAGARKGDIFSYAVALVSGPAATEPERKIRLNLDHGRLRGAVSNVTTAIA